MTSQISHLAFKYILNTKTGLNNFNFHLIKNFVVLNHITDNSFTCIGLLLPSVWYSEQPGLPKTGWTWPTAELNCVVVTVWAWQGTTLS